MFFPSLFSPEFVTSVVCTAHFYVTILIRLGWMCKPLPPHHSHTQMVICHVCLIMLKERKFDIGSAKLLDLEQQPWASSGLLNLPEDNIGTVSSPAWSCYFCEIRQPAPCWQRTHTLTQAFIHKCIHTCAAEEPRRPADTPLFPSSGKQMQFTWVEGRWQVAISLGNRVRGWCLVAY